MTTNKESRTARIERLFGEAIELRDREEFPSALEKLNEILSENKKSDAAILGIMGNIYKNIQDLPNAFECYQRSVELNPNSELASLGFFHTLWNMGKEWEAYAEAKRFLAIRDSEEYFRMIEEMKEAFEAAGIDVSSEKSNTDYCS